MTKNDFCLMPIDFFGWPVLLPCGNIGLAKSFDREATLKESDKENKLPDILSTLNFCPEIVREIASFLPEKMDYLVGDFVTGYNYKPVNTPFVIGHREIFPYYRNSVPSAGNKLRSFGHIAENGKPFESNDEFPTENETIQLFTIPGEQRPLLIKIYKKSIPKYIAYDTFDFL